MAAALDTAERTALAAKGDAERDGSFPIRNRRDLEHAVRDWGRAGSKESDRRWIIKRARALGATDLLPADWPGSTKQEAKEAGDLTFLGSYAIELREADVDKERGEARVMLIAAGTSNGVNGRVHYPRDVLTREARKFEGVAVFDNHQSDREEKEKPYRSIREHVATIREVGYDATPREGAPEGGLVGLLHCHEPWFRERITGAPETVKFSIRASGIASKSKSVGGDSVPILESFTGVRSCDAVHKAGAGGRVLNLMEAAAEEHAAMEVLLEHATPEQLRAALESKESEVRGRYFVSDDEKDWKKKMAQAKADNDEDKHDRLLNKIPGGVSHDRLECHICQGMHGGNGAEMTEAGTPAPTTTGESDMTKDELQAALKEAMAPIQAKIEAIEARSQAAGLEAVAAASGLPKAAQAVLLEDLKETALPEAAEARQALIDRKIARLKTLAFGGEGARPSGLGGEPTKGAKEELKESMGKLTDALGKRLEPFERPKPATSGRLRATDARADPGRVADAPGGMSGEAK